MRRLACLAALLASAGSQGSQESNLTDIIDQHKRDQPTVTSLTNGRTSQTNLVDDKNRQTYCQNTLPQNSFSGVDRSNVGIVHTTANDDVRAVTALSNADECSVDELTCRYGSFFPPRAACKQNQCAQWDSPVSSNNKFGKVAEVSEAQSYLYTDDKSQKKVKVTVYVNERWTDADLEVYLRSDSNGAAKFKYSSQGNSGGWTRSDDASSAGTKLLNTVPAYFKLGGNPCVVALQREITWADWIRELNSAPAQGWTGAEDLNVNQVVVKASAKEEYVQWDKRLPNVTNKDLKQVVEQVLNVVIRYPHTVVARTPVFTLTDEKHVDVQVTSLKIHEVKWGVSDAIARAAHTEFKLELELESQVQAPFRLKENISVVGKPGDMVLSGGVTPRQVADCELQAGNQPGGFVSPNGRFFDDQNEPVQICSQKWSLTASVTLDGRCEIPADFGFRWEVDCASALYSGADCPLKSGNETFEVKLSDLVDSPDVLWICPHMISEHPVHTEFKTYRDAASVANRNSQEVFVAGETLYADIDLRTNWGFLAIQSATLESLKISYDRNFSNDKWAQEASRCQAVPKGKKVPGGPCPRCGSGGQAVGMFCEYVLKDRGNLQPKLDLLSYGESANGTELQYLAAPNGAEQNEEGCYNDGVEVVAATKQECEDLGNHWGKMFNNHHYKIGFNFELNQAVFPEPYKLCDAKRWEMDDKGEMKFRGKMKGADYQKQEYLGGEGLSDTGEKVDVADVIFDQGGVQPQLTDGKLAGVDATYQGVTRRVIAVSDSGTKFVLSFDCEFNKGNMKFLAEVLVDYGDAGRRRLLVESSLHHKGVKARTNIAIESRAEAAYEEALDVAALQELSALTAPAVPRAHPAEQVQMLAQQDEPPPPPPEDWTGPIKGIALGGVAVVLLLMLICYIHKKERKRHKQFDDSMEGLLKKYKLRSDDPESIEERPASRVRIKEPEKLPLGDKIEEHDEDTIPDQGIIVQHPQPTAIAAFGEDAPDPDDLPPVPTHRRGESRPGPDDTVSLGVPPTQRASSSVNANSCRGTILHAVHSVQSVPSYRQPSLQSLPRSRSVTSARSMTSNTTQVQRSNGVQSATLSSQTVRSHITSKRGTEERDPTVTMSTCTDYVIDRGPDAPAPPV